jgi:hypothetical protein
VWPVQSVRRDAEVASTWQQRFENVLQLLVRIVRVKVLHELVGEMRVASTEIDTPSDSIAALVGNAMAQFDLLEVVSPASCVTQVGVL